MTDRGQQTLMVVFDVTDPELEIPDVRRVITGCAEFTNWWNHIPGTYLITTSLNAGEVAERLRPSARDARFLVIAVDPAQSEGWLPERAWRWIGRRSRSTLAEAAM